MKKHTLKSMLKYTFRGRTISDISVKITLNTLFPPQIPRKKSHLLFTGILYIITLPALADGSGGDSGYNSSDQQGINGGAGGGGGGSGIGG